MELKELYNKHKNKLAAIAAALNCEFKPRDEESNYIVFLDLIGARLAPDYYVMGTRDRGEKAQFVANFSKLQNGRKDYFAPARISGNVDLRRPAESIIADLKKRLVEPAQAEFNRLLRKITEQEAAAALEYSQLLQILEPLDLPRESLPSLNNIRNRANIDLYNYNVFNTNSRDLTAPHRGERARLTIEVCSAFALRQIMQILAADQKQHKQSKTA